jgi:hypothetical protein
MNTHTTDEQLAHDREKGAKKRPRIIDAMLSAWTPPATTTEAVTNPTDAERGAAYRGTPALISGDLSQRVPGDAGVIDAYPDEHPRAAVPFATDELLPVTFDAPPRSFVVEQSTPGGGTFAARYAPGTQPGGIVGRPMLVLAADSRPRRARVRISGTGAVLLYPQRPQVDATGAGADTSGYPLSTAELTTETTGELWVVTDNALAFVHVWVDYTGVTAVRTEPELPDRIARAARPCGCSDHG